MQGTCPACGSALIVAVMHDGRRITLDADPVHGGTYGCWAVTQGLNVVWRARVATAENHFGDAGHRIHDCPGAIGQQMQIGAA